MMEEVVLVSVILPVYNGESFVAEAIGSILNQTFKDFELIIINDGSTDKSLDIIKSFKDSRIILINQENKGLIQSLNSGISLAKGKLIARMDADDVAFERRLELQVKMFKENSDLVLCSAGIIEFNEWGGEKARYYPLREDDIRAEFLFNSAIVHPLSMFLAQVVRDNKISFESQYKYCEDYKFFFEILKHGKIVNIPKFLLKYRVLSTSQTAIGNSKENERFARITSIQQEALAFMGLPAENSRFLELHYRLSLTDEIKKIDFKATPVLEIIKYFDELLAASKSSKFCTSRALKSNLGEKLLKILLYASSNLTIKSKLNLIVNKYFIFGVLSILNRRLKYEKY